MAGCPHQSLLPPTTKLLRKKKKKKPGVLSNSRKNAKEKELRYLAAFNLNLNFIFGNKKQLQKKKENEN